MSDWLDAVALMSGEQRAAMFRGKDGPLACILVGYQVCGTELEKLPEQQDWRWVSAALGRLAAKARGLSVEALWASFIRSKIIAQAEFCKDIDGARATASEALETASVEPGVRFLICGTMGRQYVLARRYNEARFWLGMALQKDASTVFKHERMLVLLGASQAFGIEKPHKGVEYARQAALVAEGSEFVPEIERARAFAELAVAEFLASGAKAAYANWDKAAEYLVATSDSSDDWKDLAVIFGHVSLYPWKMASTGEPPKTTRDGSAYLPPERGLFLTTNPARIKFFQERAQSGLWLLLGSYAETVGSMPWAATWNERATKDAEQQDFMPLFVVNMRDSVPRLLRVKGVEYTVVERGKQASPW